MSQLVNRLSYTNPMVDAPQHLVGDILKRQVLGELKFSSNLSAAARTTYVLLQGLHNVIERRLGGADAIEGKGR